MGSSSVVSAKTSLAPREVAVIYANVSPAASEARSGEPALNRTATAAGCSTVGTVKRQGVSPVVAAVLRRPACQREHTAPPSRCRIGFCSGTLPQVKCSATRFLSQNARISLVSLATRCRGSAMKQSNSKVLPRLPAKFSSAASTRAAAPRTAPNPSIEGMPKRLRLSVTPHVKR